MLNYSSKCQLTLGIILLCTFSTFSFSMEQNDPNEVLYNRLAEITSINTGKAAECIQIENDCLALIKDFDSEAQKGIIYAEIAKACSDKGFALRNDIRVAKTFEYCQKALDYPLDAITRCEMYSRLADSMISGSLELPPDQFVKLRQEAVVACLKGLRIAFDNNAPDAFPRLPTIDLHVADRKKVKEQYNARFETRRKWELECNFFFARFALTELCVTLYSHKPYNIDEFRQLGQKYLIGHTEEIDELTNIIQGKSKKVRPDIG